MSEAVANPQPVPLLKYRETPRVPLDFKVQCPFCLKVSATTLPDLVAHIPKCYNYDYFKEWLPTSPASAIMIRPAYSLVEYFADEEAYFTTIKNFAATGQLADAPTDSIDTLLDYIGSIVSLTGAACITPLGRKAIAWRIINNMFEMNEEAVDRMLGFLNELSAAADDD